ncbi:hypothetical protein PDE_06207 [Penicillium oxalicum 114-2]|uniref:Uncharacterized protein n=1 Tax=Penicillium oxalicum (strain 114-2 / CGMCC 5302) TaxID=933388 RepID=S8B915_PENO1|nr:hypothetical protein PDE_06207 [Penicillium oxalicum 114-2]
MPHDEEAHVPPQYQAPMMQSFPAERPRDQVMDPWGDTCVLCITSWVKPNISSKLLFDKHMMEDSETKKLAANQKMKYRDTISICGRNRKGKDHQIRDSKLKILDPIYSNSAFGASLNLETHHYWNRSDADEAANHDGLTYTQNSF